MSRRAASSDPAMPVLMRCVQPKWSARVWAQMPAFTLPTPHLTTTTSFSPRRPEQKSVPATRSTRASASSALRCSTSTSMAPMIPIFMCSPSVREMDGFSSQSVQNPHVND